MRKQTAWRFLPAAFLFAVPILPQAAQAADITVDEINCTLSEAIESANNDSAAGNGCTDGSGEDIITLAANVTLAAEHKQHNHH
jgi:hypothetical protein